MVIDCYSQPFNVTASIAYNGTTASGQYIIYRDQNTYNITISNLRKPLIFIPGFDPNGQYAIDPSGQYSKCDGTGKSDLYSLINSGTYDGNTSLASRLHSQGYDIVVLKFDNAGDYIQRNAFLLVELINEINANKPSTSGPLVIMGYSMGGLVARYALAYMEANGMNHQTRLYVSYDSPHKGAHVPVGIQAFGLTFNGDYYKLLYPQLASALNMFMAPAAMQMLRYRLTNIQNEKNDTGMIPLSTTYISFMTELNGLNSCGGFPKNCRNIAVSLGSWNGIPQRSNLDLDNDGINDYQYPSFPYAYINFSKGDNGSPTSIWQLNTCDIVANVSFQVIISTMWSNNYPYSSQRSSYANLGNYGSDTYLYYQNPTSPIANEFPGGLFTCIWYYQNYEPTDFAPGSFVPAYDQMVNALSSQINCSFDYASNATFIPTVSALCFDTNNLFYDIGDDPNMLDKTPFDAIYGLTGDNTGHLGDNYYVSANMPCESCISTDPGLVNWLVDQITNNYIKGCAKRSTALSGDVTSGSNVLISQTNNIVTTNYTIETGANVQLKAATGITLQSGITFKVGSPFSMTILPCSSKSCYMTISNPY